MRKTDLPNITPGNIPAVKRLRQAITDYVNLAEEVKGTTANELSTWFKDAAIVAQAKLNAASPQVET